MTKWFRVFLVVAVAFLTLAIVVVLRINFILFDSLEGLDVGCRVYRGSNIYQVANDLASKGLIRDRKWFLRAARWHGLDTKLRAGIYSLDFPLSAWKLAETLSIQKPRYIKMVLREGLSAREIAEKFAKNELADPVVFLALIREPEDMVRIPSSIPTGDLEGFLFPDTYYFPPLRAGSEPFLIETMLHRFDQVVVQLHGEEIKGSPFDLKQLVTIASMIQWEVLRDEERAIVGGVIVNRLKRDMRLDIDSTIWHALGERKFILTREDLEIDSPYNTRRFKGLPPGPICSPGLASFIGALRPELGDYLYYVADGDGGHVFSRTYDEHRRAARRWRHRIRERSMKPKALELKSSTLIWDESVR